MEAAAVFLPLCAAIVAGFFGRWIGDRGAQLVTCLAVTVTAILSVFLLISVGFQHQPRTVELFTWIDSGSFEVVWSLRVDALTAVMMFLVGTVSAAVHWYSIGYMANDPDKPRFMAYLSLFTFFMLMLVTANDLVQLYFGWEGVGLVSYLLVGFWYDRPSANSAAIKAFIQNRVGDFGFALGIMAVFYLTGSVSLDTVFAEAPELAQQSIDFLGFEANALTLICLLLFLGAMGKSAQLGLHPWLADAMEGPTPVSALIHAATMVTAGVFMVARLSPLFEYSQTALDVVTFVGATTCLVAATIGMTQFDIKRVIAYSTMSQLGYMFFACGVSAYPAAIFHLLTHGFFKALLFLSAGSVIHAMSDEQDMRKMGGIWKLIPFTYAMMWIGSLALAGIPIFAGAYSKDIILESTFAADTPMATYAFFLGTITAVLTAFYSWRLLFLTFHGEPRANEHVMAHIHESPLIMTIPLGFLAIGATCAGLLFYEPLVGAEWRSFWGESIFVLSSHSALEDAHHVSSWIQMEPIVMASFGIALAVIFYLYRHDWAQAAARALAPLNALFSNKWYFDELYDFLFVRPSMRLGALLWKRGDEALIDGLGPNGIAAIARLVAGKVARLQTGYVFHYAFAMVIGLVLLVSWFTFGDSLG